MRRSRSKLPSLFAGVVFIVSAFGCNSRHSIDSQTAPLATMPVATTRVAEHKINFRQEIGETNQGSQQPAESNREPASRKLVSVEPTLAGSAQTETTLPSPGRTNAFEFSASMGFAELNQSAAERQLRVIGFVNAGQPSVMLVIDGKTHILSAAQSFEHVTVQSIDPPTVQVTNHGAPQTLSLFE